MQKPPSVQFALSQHYVIGSTEKTVNSKITLHVDPSTNLIKQYVSFCTPYSCCVETSSYVDVEPLALRIAAVQLASFQS